MKSWIFYSKVVLLSVLSLSLSACFSDVYSHYVGYWERQDTEQKEVLQISEDTGAYVLNENIFREKDIRGNKKKLFTLSKSEGHFTANNGFSDVPIVLSDDKKVLKFSRYTYKKIDLNRVKEIETEIALKEKAINDEKAKKLKELELAQRELEKKRQEDELNKAKCTELINEINTEIKELKKYAANNKVWTEKYNNLKAVYSKKALGYKDCKPSFF